MANGNPRYIEDPGGRVTTFTYDSMGRRITIDAPDTLDAAGTTLTNITRTSYTPRGEVEAEWGGQTYPTFRTYDSLGRLSTLRTKPALDTNDIPTNSGGSVTTWLYSPTRGWLVEKNYHGETDAGTTDADYTYTPAGRLKTRTWERGVVTTYGYDQGMLETVTYTNDPANTPNLTHTYDSFGRQETVTQTNQSVIDYTYDPATLALDTETISYDLDQDGTADFTRVLDRKPTSLGRDTGWQLKDGATIENEATYTYHATTGRLSDQERGNPQIQISNSPTPTNPTATASSTPSPAPSTPWTTPGNPPATCSTSSKTKLAPPPFRATTTP
jgi:YD repeat-containing protein